MNLFTQIEELLPHLHGWCVKGKAHTLASMVLSFRPNTIVEIGVWGGRSLIPMALACKEVGKGTVTGIDPWLPVASIEGQPKEHTDWWGTQDHELVRQHFEQKVTELGLRNHVNIIRKRSDDVTPPTAIDILHNDGNHGPQAIRDIERFAPNVRVGGMVVLDDLNWAGGNVSVSVEKLKAIGFEELFRVYAPHDGQDWATFQRTK